MQIDTWEVIATIYLITKGLVLCVALPYYFYTRVIGLFLGWYYYRF